MKLKLFLNYALLFISIVIYSQPVKQPEQKKPQAETINSAPSIEAFRLPPDNGEIRPDPIRPRPPGGLTVNVSGNTAKLTWNRTDESLRYVIQYIGNGTWQTIYTSNTNYTLTSLAPGTYNWEVMAYSNKAGSDYRRGTNFTIVAPPLAPSGLDAQTDRKTVTLHWLKVNNAASYTLQYKPAGSSSWKTLTNLSSSTNSYSLSSLDFGKYEWQIQAVNAGGSSPYAKGNFEIEYNSFTEENYIKVTEYLTESGTSGDTKTTYTYYDGLGREKQTVSVAASPLGKDIITHYEYDEFGRQVKDHLPVPSLHTNGRMVREPESIYKEYYDKNYQTQNYYSEKELENSPLDRLLKQASPGDSWKLGSGHEVKLEYQTNSSGEVALLKAQTTWEASKQLFEPVLKMRGSYEAGQLYKTITKDENWKPSDGTNHTLEEFKDKEGRVVLKRTYNNQEKHDTYYVYDEYGNLTYVLPPALSENIKISSGNDTPIIKEDPSLIGTTYSEEAVKAITGKYKGFVWYSDIKYFRETTVSIRPSEEFPEEEGLIEVILEEEGSEFPTKVYFSNYSQLISGVSLGNYAFNFIYDPQTKRLRFKASTTNFDTEIPKAEPRPEMSQEAIREVTGTYKGVISVNRKSYKDVYITVQDAGNTTVKIEPVKTQSEVPKIEFPSYQVSYSTIWKQKVTELNTLLFDYTVDFKELTVSMRGDGYFTGKLVSRELPKTQTEVSFEQILESLDDLGYQYKYDHRNRLVEKKLPGKGWEYLVYDQQNRLTATQDAQQRKKEEGLFTKYDKFGRAVMTGIFKFGTTREQAQKTVNTKGSNNEERTTEPLAGIPAYYTNTAYPELQNPVEQILTLTYYDSYENTGAPEFFEVEGQKLAQGIRLKGQVCAVYTQTLTAEPGKGIWTYSYFDTKDRAVRILTKNHLGGFTQVDTKLDFRSKPQYILTTHSQKTQTAEITLKESFTYDKQERLLTHTHQVNGGIEEYLVRNTYDELGKHITKKTGGDKQSPLQQVDYTYNIRGWLTQINDLNNLNKTGQPEDLFAFTLSYDQPEFKHPNFSPLYNGNITETQWKTTTDKTKRQYAYRYDPLSRLLTANYLKNYNPETQSFTVANAYNETLSYDKNGNILTLSRTGEQDQSNNIIQIDQLTYTYKQNSNQHLKTTDASNHPAGFTDGINTGDDYAYDDNGNMIQDLNKGIQTITYNHLNLPEKISFGSRGEINYLYDALGTKLQKQVKQGGKTEVTEYLGGFQYKGGELQFFPHAEGYVKKEAGNYSYVYNYTDHLGNVRLSYTQENNELKVLEETHYYPFGLSHKGYNNTNNQPGYNYKYNGKELQEELNLNIYDYGARNYDPVLGRWFNLDPLSEDYHSYSPFNYTLNNPVNLIDPDGRSVDDWVKDKYGFYKDFNKIQSQSDFNNSGLANAGYEYIGKELPEGIKGSYYELEQVGGSWYHANTNNEIASVGNWLNEKLGGDADYFVEKKLYNPVGEKALETVIKSAPIGGGISRVFTSKSNDLHIPKGWETKPSKKNNGTIYYDPNNPHNRIRVMPGKSNSPNPSQQTPYIKFQKDGVFYDKTGKPLPSGDIPASHIPRTEYNSKVMPKFK